MMREVHGALEGSDLIYLLCDATKKLYAGDEILLRCKSRHSVFSLEQNRPVDKQKLLARHFPNSATGWSFAKCSHIGTQERRHRSPPSSTVKGPFHRVLGTFPKIKITIFHAFHGLWSHPARGVASPKKKFTFHSGCDRAIRGGPKLTRIAAHLLRARKSDPVGKGAKCLKLIGTKARLEIEKMVETRSFGAFCEGGTKWRDSERFVDGLDCSAN